MLLSTTQTAEKLNISVGQVKGLIKRGELKDHASYNKDKKKHYFKLDSKEVNEFKNQGKVPRARAINHETNGKVVGFNSRLESIEKKLDILISIWK